VHVTPVRDHVKVIYGNAGVNSRGELVAALFANLVLVHPDVVRA
jgi:hypothetical protein